VINFDIIGEVYGISVKLYINRLISNGLEKSKWAFSLLNNRVCFAGKGIFFAKKMAECFRSPATFIKPKYSSFFAQFPYLNNV